MNVYEMEGFLRGKCLPRDILVNESTAEYLVRKMYEATAVKAERDALAVENARCKFEVSRCHQTIDEMFKNRDKWIDKEWLAAIWSTSKRLMNETPATSAALAAIEARGVEKAIELLLNKFSGTGHIGVPVMVLESLATELREAK